MFSLKLNKLLLPENAFENGEIKTIHIEGRQSGDFVCKCLIRLVTNGLCKNTVSQSVKSKTAS